MTRISKLSYIFLVTITSVLFSANSILFSQTKQTLSDGKYNYETVENDPLKARIYTLENGLKVYLTVNKNTPRIQTYIAIEGGYNARIAELLHNHRGLSSQNKKKLVVRYLEIRTQC